MGEYACYYASCRCNSGLLLFTRSRKGGKLTNLFEKQIVSITPCEILIYNNSN